MGKYDAASALARNLIGAKGTDVTFTRSSVATFDPITQAESVTTVTFSMKGLGLAPGRSAEYAIGSLRNRNIIELHLAPQGGTTPLMGDSVSWAGANWTVIWVDVLDPAADGAPYCKAYAER